MTTIPTLVCNLCPLGRDAFYCRQWAEFLEHLQAQHGMFPGRYVGGIPLTGREGLVFCAKCGMETGPQFDGYCGPCFMAKWSD